MKRARYPVAPVRRRPRRIAKKITKRHGMATFAGAWSWRILDQAQAALVGLTTAAIDLMTPTRAAARAFEGLLEVMTDRDDVSKFDEDLTTTEQDEFDQEFNR